MRGEPEKDDATSSLEYRAEALKERLYVSFTSFVVVIALTTHAENSTPGSAAATLTLTAIGTVLAVLLADVIAHMTLHSTLPSRAEFRRMLTVSVGSLTVLVVPLLLLLLAGLGAMELMTALRIGSYVLIGTLGIVTFIAIRRLRLPFWNKVATLAGVVLFALVVLLVELAVH